MINEMIEKARTAAKELENFSQEQVDAIVREIGKTVYDNAEYYAKLAVEETRMGVYEDKINKNKGKARIIWNSLKGKKSVGVINRDEDNCITEIARPVGVVGAITPCTNPIVTPMCNAMFAVKGRNPIIVAPHPRAKKANKIVCDEIIRRITALGAPANTIQYIEEPTSDLSAQLMHAVDVVVATGGMGMVRAAYSSGKPALGVGAGNVQCIVDEGIDFADAAAKIIAGRKFDNGIICSGEQTVIAPEKDYDTMIEALKANGAYFVSDAETKQKLRDAIFPEGVMNKNLVGQSVAKIAETAGIEVPADTKVILVEADGCGKADLFCKEKMCPVIATFKYNGIRGRSPHCSGQPRRGRPRTFGQLPHKQQGARRIHRRTRHRLPRTYKSGLLDLQRRRILQRSLPHNHPRLRLLGQQQHFRKPQLSLLPQHHPRCL